MQHSHATRHSTSAKCGACDKALTKKNYVICEYCTKGYHPNCQGVTPEMMSAISACGDSFHWFCKTCNPKALDVLRVVQTLKDKNDELEARLETVEGKLTSVGEEFKDFKERQEQINIGLAEKVDKKLNESTSESVAEMREREMRKEYLIFFNIPESKKEDSKERIRDDMEQLKEILQTVEASDSEPQHLIRLGPKGTEPRPLKARFKRQEDCWKVLKGTENLRGTDFFISRDMTPLEREERRALVKLKKEKEAESEAKGEEAKWKIRRGKVINTARKGTRTPREEGEDRD